jgi:hypothetical protein
MILSIMQPTFNPWLGYFDMMDQSDVFVIYDDVQLSKQSWQVRNRIKTAGGELYLSIPYLKTDSYRDLLIYNAQTNETLLWREKHLKSIENSYRRAPFFSEVFPFLKGIYEQDNKTVASFTANMIRRIVSIIGIETNLINSSDLGINGGSKDMRLVNFCQHFHAGSYLSPQGSAVYIEEKSPGGEFAKAGIEVYYHEYKHPVYNQVHGDFIPYMGVIDLLFNLGFSNSLAAIRSGRQSSIHYRIFNSNK